ncbi:MAG: saccharopine dehydrogenase NADP-binding domain-containing protein [Saprospiraceae bacterium]|nr:saccharopine dehydrogenase NADP-binding domain-containing protein [Saprospiraceae bacterium]
MEFLLYGANGYTGKIIAEMAAEFGLKPTLAGRTESKVKPIAEELGFDYKIFSLDDQAATAAALEPFKVVLHAAGPFKYTAKPMMEACVATKTHYVDITGEIAIFEMAARFDKAAKAAGIMILPGGGFDVVPTDGMASFLKKELPDATHLQLAFASVGGGVSHGTASTMAEHLGEGGAIRKDGKITKVPMGHKAMTVPFWGKDLFTMTIPWGDVSTAYYSTGIPNIEVFTGVKPKSYKMIKWQKYFNWLLKTSLVRNYVKNQIKKKPAGPSQERRAKSQSLVWGKVWNDKGEEKTGRMITPEGYTLTAITSLKIVQKVLNGEAPVGFQTPSNAYGDLIMEVDGVQRELV